MMSSAVMTLSQQNVSSVNWSMVATNSTWSADNVVRLALDSAAVVAAAGSVEAARSKVRKCKLLSQFAILSVAGGGLCLLGLVGNALSLVALKRDSISPVASLLLQSLACVDSVFILLWSWLFSIRSALRFFGVNLSNPTLYPYIELYAFPLLFVLQSATVWLTVTIAVTRYIAICLPFVANRLVTLTTVRATVVGVAVGSLIYNLPRFFATAIEVVERDGRSRVMFNTTTFGRSYLYATVYSDIMYYLFSFGLPLTILVALNSRLIICYRVIKRRRHTVLLRNSVGKAVAKQRRRPRQQRKATVTSKVTEDNQPHHLDLTWGANGAGEVTMLPPTMTPLMTPKLNVSKSSNNNNVSTGTGGGCGSSTPSSNTSSSSGCGGGTTEEINITLVMIAVIIVFIMCTAPARLVQIVWGYTPASCPDAAFFATEISSVLEVLNSSANFLVYISVRPAFRTIVANVFWIGRRRSRDLRHSRSRKMRAAAAAATSAAGGDMMVTPSRRTAGDDTRLWHEQHQLLEQQQQQHQLCLLSVPGKCGREPTSEFQDDDDHSGVHLTTVFTRTPVVSTENIYCGTNLLPLPSGR